MPTIEEKLYGADLFGKPIAADRVNGHGRKFIVAPTSLLDTREPFWKERRAAYMSLGIGVGKIDPVTCECIYSWFCPPGGTIVDPYASDCVPGVVASLTGLRYFGLDDKPNETRDREGAAASGEVQPKWFTGDNRELMGRAGTFDLLFAAIHNERRDSDYDSFLKQFSEVMRIAVSDKLMGNRFAVLQVDEFVNAAGFRRNFAGSAIQVLRQAGMEFYGEAVVIGGGSAAAAKACRRAEENSDSGNGSDQV